MDDTCNERPRLWLTGPFSLLSLLLLLAMPEGAMAQSGNDPTGGSSAYGSGSSGNGADPVILLGGDGPIIDRLDRIARVCGHLPRQYRIHCLGYQYDALAAQIPRSADYRDMRTAIEQAARGLRRLAADNVDPAAPTARVPRVAERVPAIARRQAPAVRRDTLDQTLRAAEAILEEAQTVLLRSAENTRNRSVAYQRVAAAIDSSKVLLRSA